MDIRKEVERQLDKLGTEKYLQEKGIDKNSIQEGKNEIASIAGEKLIYYDEAKGEVADVLVPISQIKGVSRISDFTWFDLLNYGAAGLPENIAPKDFNLNTNSFLGVLSWLEGNEIEEVKNMYKNTSNIHLDCFQNKGMKEYYQHTDGNHRVITAKVIGIREIRARSVQFYEYNKKKHNIYQMYKDKEKQLIEMIEELGLLAEITKMNDRIVILDVDNWYEKLFQFTYDDQDLTGDFSRIYKMVNEVEQCKKRLRKIKKDADVYYSIYKMFPEKVRSFIKRLTPSHVKDKGISHVIALKKADALSAEKAG